MAFDEYGAYEETVNESDWEMVGRIACAEVHLFSSDDTGNKPIIFEECLNVDAGPTDRVL